MLSKIREKLQGVLAIFVLSLLAIPFALWGIGSYFEGGSAVPIAEVNGVEIGQQAYRERLEELRRADVQQADSVLKQLVIENLIGQTLLLMQARDAGYRMSDAQLARMIHGLPYFQSDGRFEPALYQAFLRSRGLTPTEFEEQLRQEGVQAQLQRGLSESAFVTEADVAEAVRLLRQKRRFSYAVVGIDAFLPDIRIEDQEIEAYYRANPESFRVPEAVRIAYLTLKAADIGQDIEPSGEELRRAYEAEAGRFVTPERRRVSHILIEVPEQGPASAADAARARAEELLQQVRAGADFAALAKKHSDDPLSATKGGDLGDITRGVLPAELEAAVFALAPGAVSEPVRTSFGYHLAKLITYTPQTRRSYEEVKPELAEMVRARKGEEEFYDLAERFRNLVYEQPQGLEPAAEALGLKVQTSDWFTPEGGDGIAAEPRVVEAAFDPEVLDRERNSDAIELDAGSLVALRVIDHRPSAIRPLAEVRSEIERLLKAERARARAKETASRWVEQLEHGKTLRELARAPGVTYHDAKTLTREQPGGIDPRLADGVFTAPRPKDRPVVGQVGLGARGHAVYAIDAVTDVDPSTVDAEFTQKVRQQLRQGRGADYYLSYRAGLRRTADVRIYAEQL